MLMFFGVAVLLAGQQVAAQRIHEYPLVMRADAPLYPPLARMAKITGRIEVKLSVKNGEVVVAEAKVGHPLLVRAAVENVKSWHFAPETEGTFTATFVYELRGSETATMQNPRVEMQLPTFVKMTATPTRAPCNDCEPGAEITGKPRR